MSVRLNLYKLFSCQQTDLFMFYIHVESVLF